MQCHVAILGGGKFHSSLKSSLHFRVKDPGNGLVQGRSPAAAVQRVHEWQYITTGKSLSIQDMDRIWQNVPMDCELSAADIALPVCLSAEDVVTIRSHLNLKFPLRKVQENCPTFKVSIVRKPRSYSSVPEQPGRGLIARPLASFQFLQFKFADSTVHGINLNALNNTVSFDSTCPIDKDSSGPSCSKGGQSYQVDKNHENLFSYPVDRAVHPLNNWGLLDSAIERFNK